LGGRRAHTQRCCENRCRDAYHFRLQCL